MTTTLDHTENAETFLATLRTFVGQEATPVRHAQEPVNRAMIRHFVEAMGDENPIYLDPEAAAATGRDQIVAPPPMLSTWLMVGYRAHMSALQTGAADSPMARLLQLLNDRGFTGVVATNDEQTYHRELIVGDQLAMSTVIEDVSPLKKTGLGTGHFVTTLRTYRDASGEVVAEQRFRILRFDASAKETPKTSVALSPETDIGLRPKPFILQDNEFWFKAAAERRLVIQACTDCGVLRHPPSPMCAKCQSWKWHEVAASGRGTVHSFVISHHPKAPGFDYPHSVVLVDLAEGTRLVADFVGTPEALAVGLAVQVEWLDYDPELTLPRFRAVEENH